MLLEMAALRVWEVVLYVAALLALVWILTPALAFALGLMRYRVNVRVRRDEAGAGSADGAGVTVVTMR